jgi:hypothetical protein
MAMGASAVVGLFLTGLTPATGTLDDPPPPPKKKKGGPPGPGGELRKAYDLLRRLRAGDRTAGRPEERLRDWTDRATRLYRDAIRSRRDGDERLAREYGAAAHNLARAVDHARNAALFELRDEDLPSPPDDELDPDDSRRVLEDLSRAYERMREAREVDVDRGTRFYLDAARDLYNAARRDAAQDRWERAGELVRAAEAMTHVSKHLRHAQSDDRGPAGPGRERPEPKKQPEEAKGKPDRARAGDRGQPPPID